MLRHSAALAAAIACASCGIKGPLYLPPPAQPGAAVAPAAVTPSVEPGPSSPPPPSPAGTPAEKKVAP